MGLIEGNPTAVQLAGDDWWESALVRTVGQSRWSAEEVRALARSYEDLAVEVFIRNMDGREGFIGLRYAGSTVEPVVERVLGLAGSVLAGELSGVDDVVQVLRFHSRELSAGAPVGIELGVVNAWRSVGSLVFWRAGKRAGSQASARAAPASVGTSDEPRRARVRIRGSVAALGGRRSFEPDQDRARTGCKLAAAGDRRRSRDQDERWTFFVV